MKNENLSPVDYLLQNIKNFSELEQQLRAGDRHEAALADQYKEKKQELIDEFVQLLKDTDRDLLEAIKATA